MATKETTRDQQKGGELPTPGGHGFDMTGGELCLDFVNTLEARPSEQPRELLSDFDHLVAWATQAGAISPEVGGELRLQAARHPRGAAAVLKRARELREAIFGVFSASVAGTPPPPGDLTILNRHLPTTLAHLRLAGGCSDFRWEWEDQLPLDRMLWPVVRSAAELLTSDQLSRVRRCSADACDWLFLDQSRNRSRRWCDMSVCGNRDKVRRFRNSKRN